MSWLKKVLGTRSAEEWLGEATEKEDAGELGEAKLAYDRAFERAKSDELRTRAEEGADRCCDGLAKQRVEQALELARAGNMELAHEELRSALDTARSDAAKQDVRQAMHSLERDDAVAASEPQAEISIEERYALIAGNWDSLQAEELESYGDEFMLALARLDEGQAEAALEGLLATLEAADDPRYLWLEIGRARLAAEQLQEAEEALRTFLSKIGPDEGGNARLVAHMELARMAHEREDVDAAIAELEACAEALDEDPRPFLQLGSYLRVAGRPAEAVEVLQLCTGLFPEGQTEWPVLMELGLAQAEAGQPAAAVQSLEGVVELLAGRGHTDFPPALGIALAKLHEDQGNLTRAADLYRSLAEGSHVEGHQEYHEQAARLLKELGLSDEAARMEQRAEAIATQSR